MLKTLIAIEADLASRMAIRYACQLGAPADLEIKTIHIAQPEDQGGSPGTGWVRQTWEDAVLERIKNQVFHLVKSEQSSLRILSPPKVVSGNRDQITSDELRFFKYDFFTEGLFHRFAPVDFFEKIQSPLYRNLPCPALMVKNWVSLTRGILFLTGDESLEKLNKTFAKIFHSHSIEPDVLFCEFDKASSSPEMIETPSRLVDPVNLLFGSHERNVNSIKTVKGSPSSLVHFVSDYSLILSSVPDKESHMAKLLSKSPCSILFCP